MGEDMTMTKPIGDGADASTTGQLVTSEFPRRRLGSRLSAPGATDDLAPVPSPIPTSSGAPVGVLKPLRANDGGMTPSPFGQTIPLGQGDTSATMPLTPNASAASATATAEFVPSASDATLPFSEREAKRAEWEAHQAQASTVHLVGGDVTASIAAPADSEGDRTVRLGLGTTQPVVITDVAELSMLRRRAAGDPGDLDVRLELALALQECGEIGEAATILASLVAIYEEQGAADEAAQIHRLLGDLATRDIGTASTSATASTSDLSTQAPANSVTATITPRLGRTTVQLPSRTAPLNDRLASARDGRRRPAPAESSAADLFPRHQLVATHPLPMTSSLTPEGAEMLAIAESELAAGHLRAALDSLNLAVTLSSPALGLHIRLAEIRLQLGHHRKARSVLDQLQSLSGPSARQIPAWMVERLLLHTGNPDVGTLRRVVDLLTEAGELGHASTYAAALIRVLDAAGNHEAALACASLMTATLPGDTKIALEGAVLAARHASHGEVIDLWELAVSHGADADVAKSSMAASVASASEVDHWRLLSETIVHIRANPGTLSREAYLRTAEAAGNSPVLKAGRALILHAVDDPTAKEALAASAGDRHGSPVGRAAASMALANRLASIDKGDEYVAAVRTTLTLMAGDTLKVRPSWISLIGVEPNLAELSTELGEALLEAGDAAGAVEILRVWYRQEKQHAPLVRLLADAYARTGQVGPGLTILDELGMQHRKAGQLDEMAAVLRQMSRLAPTNIKVKSRLIDAYLQRGFVSEARAELIQRADLEEQAGLVKEACKSLQRAADLSWNLELMNDAFGLYDRLVALDPEDVGNRSALVNMYLQVGRLSEAAEHQRAVVDLALKHGRRHEAIAALHQVIGLTPDDMSSYYQLGELLSSMAEYRQAEKVYRRIVLMSPDDAVAQAKATAMASLKEEMDAV